MELGLLKEAMAALNELPRDAKNRSAVLVMVLRILVAERDWPKVQVMAMNLSHFMPNEASVWYAAAQAHAHQGRRAAAREALLKVYALHAPLLDEARGDPVLYGCLNAVE